MTLNSFIISDSTEMGVSTFLKSAHEQASSV